MGYYVNYLEKIVIEQVIKDVLAAGLAVSVNDGEEFVLERSTDPAAIWAVLFSTDEDKLVLTKGEDPAGWIWFFYGNNGWDVTHDYTTNLKDVLKNSDTLATLIEGGHYTPNWGDVKSPLPFDNTQAYKEG